MSGGAGGAGTAGRYLYTCTSCGRQWPPQRVEGSAAGSGGPADPGAPPSYLCPACGRCEPRRPLEGILEAAYDYGELRRRLDRGRFLALPAGRPWLYPELWPLEPGPAGRAGPAGVGADALESLALPAAPPAPLDDPGGAALSVLDESGNPTFSFKDRASILVALKALQLRRREVAAASTGNAASSLAGICARLGLTAHLFVPAAAPPAKLLQMLAYGARLYPVEGSYDEAFDLCLRACAARGWLSRNTAHNPLTLEGKKSAAYDLFLGTGGRLPEAVLVPVGDGVILSGLHKGFRELLALGWIERLPRLLAVQAAGSDALCRYLSEGSFEYRPAETAADSIAAGAPRALYPAARAVRESGGAALRVSDEEIRQAQREAASRWGRLVEPAAAASLAGLRAAQRAGLLASGERALLLFTGNGLKDAAALQSWVRPPAARRPAEWEAALLG